MSWKYKVFTIFSNVLKSDERLRKIFSFLTYRSLAKVSSTLPRPLEAEVLLYYSISLDL